MVEIKLGDLTKTQIMEYVLSLADWPTIAKDTCVVPQCFLKNSNGCNFSLVI